MVRVTLDMACSLCGRNEFLLPTRQPDGIHVRCANCTASRCRVEELENVMMSFQRARRHAA